MRRKPRRDPGLFHGSRGSALPVDFDAPPPDSVAARKGPTMQFSQRQWIFIAIFAVFWTAFMLVWSGDYRIARIAILLIVGFVVAIAWGYAMKRFGHWKDQA
jgi:hypothetical protein